MVVQKQVKLRTKDLEKALELAKKADQAKTAFLFNMSHDIRTPMNAILGYTDLLKDNLGNVEKSADYLAKIKESGDFLLTLINNVLEMARIESGHMTLDEVPCSLADIFASIGNIYAEMFRGKKIKVAKNLQFHSKYVYCDKLKITEIFVNLVSNALKYTPEGGTISVDVEEIPCDREGYTTIRAVIADTGIGMSEEFQQVLFEVFTRERNSAGNRIEGTGLGMPIVKKLVTLMGGTIEVKSKLGEGSAFTITISHRIAEDVVMEDKKETSQDLKVLQGRRILLAEDNDLNAEIAMEILKKYGGVLPLISAQKYNLYLKEVARMAGISRPVTSHWARHTGATLLLNAGVRLEVVARVLGHSSTEMTRKVYAKLLDDTVAREMMKAEEKL